MLLFVHFTSLNSYVAASNGSLLLAHSGVGAMAKKGSDFNLDPAQDSLDWLVSDALSVVLVSFLPV